MNDSLKDKSILVVGGSSGLGLAVARQAYARGAQVAVASRSAGEKREELAGLIGPGVEAVSLDVTSGEAMETVLGELGRIDHLVITTRPFIEPATFLETGLDQAKQAFDTKLWGMWALIRKAHGHMNPEGSIVMTTGIAGEKIYRNHSVMAVLNGAAEALCRALAVELAPMRVNAVSPGFIAPKPEALEAYARTFPSGRLAGADEVARAFLYLMENDYITGETLVVDGGARLV